MITLIKKSFLFSILADFVIFCRILALKTLFLHAHGGKFTPDKRGEV